MNIKEWFIEGTGLSIEKVKYLITPNYPYQIYHDEIEYYGSDLKNRLIISHSIVIERFSETIDDQEEEIIDQFLNQENLSFLKYWEWIDEQTCFKTTYKIEKIIKKQ